MIEVRNVYQAYGKHNVLTNVNMIIQEHKITGLIGPNGAGKSTLLGVISRLLALKTGEILIHGKNIKEMSNIEIAKIISVLRQNNNLAIKITVKELVTFGRFPHSKGRINDADEKAIEEAIRFMELDAISSKFIDELSGGQLQRVYIAMILAQDTPYIFLDEPLNNLDIKHTVDFMKNLQRLVKEKNKTIVIVMHDINVASAFCDHIVAMKDGEIIKEGNIDEMIQSEVLDGIFDHNFCITGIDGQRVCLYKHINIEKA
ncbi:MAG: ATP-binding cassette domain-containing protein [Bacteroidales bacterium]